MAISVSDIIAQNTIGLSEGNPVGVPASYAWYDGLYRPAGYAGPPAAFTSVTGWGQVYQKAGAPAYSNPNATIDVANAKTYIHIKATGEWVLVQNQANNQLAGAHFVADFSGNSAIAMTIGAQSGGGASLDTPPAGYNDHFWPSARGVYAAGAVDAVYVQMDMRVSDPNLQLIANVGADWWLTSSAGYVNGMANNPGAGMSNWVDLSTQWTTLGFYSSTTAQFQADLPPPLEGALNEVPKPTITLFTPDSGIVGDGITKASVLKLTGATLAGLTVNVFDGSTLIGTTKADAAGAWTLTTSQLSNAVHSFTAKAVNATGTVSTASSALTVQVDTIAPTTPKILSFSPDSDVVGDGATSATVLKLTGTAEAGSAVTLFDGSVQIGTAKAAANGTWSFSTAQLATATHSFSATATDVAGNASSASSPLNVKVSPDISEPPPASGANLLVNGSFEASPVKASWFAGFSAIPGWTAVSGGTIELWNNLNGVKATDGTNFGELDYLGATDGLYQNVQTVQGQSYNLSIDARARPGTTAATSSMDILWNDSLVARVPPGNSWETYNFTVTGTGGSDRLTLREVAGQGGDGLGAMYDNVSLTKNTTSASAQASLTQASRMVDLLNQYAAASSADSAFTTSPMLNNNDALTTLSQTLTQSQQHT
jgi:Bacterial Ig-like domain